MLSSSARWAALAALWFLLSVPVRAAEDEPAATGGSAPPAAENEGPAEPVIPAGQEELLAAMLGKGAALPGGCKLDAGDVDRSSIKATYACSEGNVVFQLTHPSNAPAKATHTTHFAITLLSGTPPAGLAEAVEQLVRSREGTFEWKQGHTKSKPMSASHLAVGAVALVAIIAIGWLLRRRTSARST